MRVVVTVQCANHVHFYRHAIRRLESYGHDVHVFARQNRAVLELLDRFEIPYTELASAGSGFGDLARTQVEYEAGLLRHARRIQPDVMTAVNAVTVGHVARLLGARSVVFTDTECMGLLDRLARPFVDSLYAPERTETEMDDVTSYPSYRELAYLHPNTFTPDRRLRQELGQSVDHGDQLVLLTPLCWTETGEPSTEQTVEFVERLEREGATVLIDAETSLPDGLEQRRVTIEPHRRHDALAAVDLVIDDTATTAVESAVLGTPAISVGDDKRRHIDELEDEYGLVFSASGRNARAEAFATAVTVLEKPPSTWQHRRERLLSETFDMTTIIVTALLETNQPARTDSESIPDATYSR